MEERSLDKLIASPYKGRQVIRLQVGFGETLYLECFGRNENMTVHQMKVLGIEQDREKELMTQDIKNFEAVAGTGPNLGFHF